MVPKARTTGPQTLVLLTTPVEAFRPEATNSSQWSKPSHGSLSGQCYLRKIPVWRVRRRFVIPADVYDTIHASSLLFDSFSSALLFRNATNNAIRLGSGW